MEISIGRKQTKILIDPEDYHLFVNHTATVTSHGYVALVFYHGKVDGRYKYTRNYLHRKIMKAPKNLQVDHINGNRLDNRKENLRLCTNGSNNRNKPAKSGYKGVHFSKTSKQWVAQITKNYKTQHLGLFPTAITAAHAYNKAAKLLHGKYAHLNPT